VRSLAAYLITAGILVTIIGSNSWWIGAGLIVLGVLVSRWLHRSRCEHQVNTGRHNIGHTCVPTLARKTRELALTYGDASASLHPEEVG
jgi:hypothetical protein